MTAAASENALERLRTAAVETPPCSPLEAEVIALYEELRRPVVRYLLALRIPFGDAEELTQDVFLALFHHLRQGKSCENPHGWIFTVAHRMALKHRARLLRRPEHGCDLSEALADSGPSPEELLGDLERRRTLLSVVRALPERDRCCLSLRAEGLRYREIARALGISLGSVANSLERSLARLMRAGGG